VRVACPGDPTAVVVPRYGQAWSSQTGVRIEVVRYDPTKGPQEGPAADVWIIQAAEMPYWAAAGQLHPVPASYTTRGGPYGWDGLLREYQKLLVWNRTAYAFPVLGDALLCFYRSDLFSDPQHQAGFKKEFGRELAAPDSWEDFADIAQYFQSRAERGEKGAGSKPSAVDSPPFRAGLPPLPESDADLDREFFSIAAPFARLAVREDDPKPPPDVQLFSFHYDLETGANRIGTSGFVKALELMKRLQACRPAARPTMAAPPESFQVGETALCLASPSWISRFQEDARIRGKFGFTRVPGARHVYDYSGGELPATSVNYLPYLGAEPWVAVVPSTNRSPEAAFALMAFLSDAKTSRDIVIEPAWGGGAFRREHFASQVGWRAFGLDPGQTEKLVECLRETLVHPQIKNPVLRLRIPEEREHQHVLLEEIRAALLQGKSAADALASASSRWRKLDGRRDPKSVRADYRLSLSLNPG
jgi:multiple sugar transport system substrate-binding protein